MGRRVGRDGTRRLVYRDLAAAAVYNRDSSMALRINLDQDFQTLDTFTGIIRPLSVPLEFDHSVTRRVAVEMVTLFRP